MVNSFHKFEVGLIANYGTRSNVVARKYQSSILNGSILNKEDRFYIKKVIITLFGINIYHFITKTSTRFNLTKVFFSCDAIWCHLILILPVHVIDVF